MDITYKEMFEFLRLYNDNVGYVSAKEGEELRAFRNGEFYLLLELLREIDRDE
jgi:hypothetical protein